MSKRTMITFFLKDPQIKELNKLKEQQNQIILIGEDWAIQYLHYTNSKFELLNIEYNYQYFVLHKLQKEEPNKALESFIAENTTYPQISYGSSNNMTLNILKIIQKKENTQEFINRNFNAKQSYFFIIMHSLNPPFQAEVTAIIEKVGEQVDAFKLCLLDAVDKTVIDNMWNKIADYLTYRLETIDVVYFDLFIELRDLLSKFIH